MLRDFIRSAAQLGDRAFLAVLVKSLLLTLLLFAAAAALVGWLLAGIDPCSLASFSCRLGAGGGAAVALIVGLAGLWFLFPAIAVAVIGLFGDDVVDAVEARHYPAARSRSLPFRRSLALSIRSAARILLWNLIAAPFYLLLLVTGIGPLLLFSAVNAVALGRDLGEMVAARHLESAILQLAARLVERLPAHDPELGAERLVIVQRALHAIVVEHHRQRALVHVHHARARAA